MHTLKNPAFKIEDFIFKQEENFNPNSIDAVLLGKQAGVIIKKYFSEQVCASVTQNFWQHPKNRAAKNFPAWIVGTSHYYRPLSEYFADVEKYKTQMDLLFTGTQHVFNHTIGLIRNYFMTKNITVRNAQHQNLTAFPFIMQSWSGKGKYALTPHEDLSYCSAPEQAEFEVQQAAKNGVVAVNICLENKKDSGQLCYWNAMPNQQTIADENAGYSGCDYSLDKLKNVKQ